MIHWAKYVRCYFTECAISLLSRWKKHINLGNFKALGIVFVTVEISFAPKYHKEKSITFNISEFIFLS